jgi:carbon-monoxide dehydrogenase medium subunit
MQLIAGAGLIATSSRTAIPAPLHRPTTIAAALALLADTGTPPVLVAGGTDLCAQFNEGLQPGAMIALDRIAALREISATAEELRIGSLVTHDAGSGHTLIRERLPGFAEAWGKIANVRVRFWATLGGNVMARRTRYEMSLLLMALDARLSFLLPDGATLLLTPADVWADRVPPRALLCHAAIPLRGRVRFHYDRSLRPITTLAVRVDDAGGAAVIATEMLRPCGLPLSSALPPAEAAAAAFADLPADFADAASDTWYLRRAGEAMLRRVLEKVRADG